MKTPNPKHQTPKKSTSRLKCSACGRKWVDHPGIAVTCLALKFAMAEYRFYREQLELIAGGNRNTREKRLARSALTFWDALKAEASAKSTADKPR